MTDLDITALRQALKTPADPGDPVDVTQIVARGRHLRRRRRLAAIAGGVGAVAVLAGTATAIASQAGSPSVPGRPVGPVPASSRGASSAAVPVATTPGRAATVVAGEPPGDRHQPGGPVTARAGRR